VPSFLPKSAKLFACEFMTDPNELIRWLKTLRPDHQVAIDDGGLTLVEIAPDGRPTDAYWEIGGLPGEDEEASATL
jgi:hypothetical protein